MKTVEIKNFELYTTGVISIAWKEKDEDIFINVDLDLAALLKMLKIEGLSYEKVQQMSENQKPLVFKKVTLLLFQDDDKPGQYYTSECMFEDDDLDIFHAEIKE
ncbi:MAG: hypothetical protein IJE76_00945 [Bacteroidales bacterium]|nr:hypothetical protein [Lentimicrobiaceae bacterium]MBQ2851940.1 hypothetical protein [Bacteroidales bacterium]MBR7175815.1 hypothetical protein [Bacteroidales bacterium]